MTILSQEDFEYQMKQNSGRTFADGFGRLWKYADGVFWFKDIDSRTYKQGLYCLHLYSTVDILPEYDLPF